ncbi:hypothetical protein [Paracoccus tibetensis]|uniref:Uncharacterized protein n=1 Tax=Paracoccus tibetensis TaxID=336292 RepID=A0A1G5HDZ3_9RHOB|nr:hypothetical protein [Paracoccus tibetensis]SCY61986.1 hypothetical protein SAMN05660710_02128 [Paracoccus tibetensis]
MNPRMAALRFRAWQISQAHDGNLTMAQLAQVLDVPSRSLSAALRGQKWVLALRTSALDVPIKPEFASSVGFRVMMDAKSFLGVPA